jgi:catechol 2,3-dioxygenase-like lactoylglutathione lyase family enzyme
MQFNHANFVVDDVAATAEFFANHFGFQVLGEPRDNFIILGGEGGFVLNLMGPGKGEAVAYPKNYHVGFFVDAAETVQSKHDELAAAGHAPGEVRELRRGSSVTTTCYCLSPGGFLVEVATRG